MSFTEGVILSGPSGVGLMMDGLLESFLVEERRRGKVASHSNSQAKGQNVKKLMNYRLFSA